MRDYLCNCIAMSFLKNELAEGEPSSQRVFDDPKERVLLRTKVVSWPEANLSDGESSHGGSREEKLKGKKGLKGERRGRMGKTGLFKNK